MQTSYLVLHQSFAKRRGMPSSHPRSTGCTLLFFSPREAILNQRQDEEQRRAKNGGTK